MSTFLRNHPIPVLFALLAAAGFDAGCGGTPEEVSCGGAAEACCFGGWCSSGMGCDGKLCRMLSTVEVPDGGGGDAGADAATPRDLSVQDLSRGPDISAPPDLVKPPGLSVLPPMKLPGHPRGIVCGDIDRDGNLDLVLSEADQNDVIVLHGKGDGTFLDAERVPTGANPQGLAIADLDGDGLLDVAVANAMDDSVTVLRGDMLPRPRLVVRGTYPTGASPVAVVTGDFDGNRIPDVASANQVGNSVSVLLNDGSGVLAAAKTSSVLGAAPLGIATADFDGDGRLDVAAAGSKQLGIHLNQGGGVLMETDHPRAGVRPTAIAALDVNGDAHLDLLVTNSPDNTLGLLLGVLGGGVLTFPKLDTFATGALPAALALADFNGDGVLDVVIADSGAATISLLKGTNGSFAPRQSLPVGQSPVALCTGDFDKDGHPDVAVASDGGGLATVLLWR